MKKWEKFRLNKTKVIEEYVRAKGLMVCMGKYYKNIKLMQILQILKEKFLLRRHHHAVFFFKK
jgi:hypothetical protein